MPNLVHDTVNENDLHYVLNHIFLPPQSDENTDPATDHDAVLCPLFCESAIDFLTHIPPSQEAGWFRITEMLVGILDSVDVFDSPATSK